MQGQANKDYLLSGPVFTDDDDMDEGGMELDATDAAGSCDQFKRGLPNHTYVHKAYYETKSALNEDENCQLNKMMDNQYL